MEGLQQIRRIRAYCDYVERHLQNVEKAWAILQDKLKDMNVVYDDFLWSQIDKLIKEHDLSKFSAEEFMQYVEWFQGPLGAVYNVQIHGDKGGEVDRHWENKDAFDKAWEHHQRCNPHHHQNWTIRKEAFPNEHSCHIVCMVADWMAMGMEFGDTAEEYYVNNKESMNIPAWADKMLEDIFNAIRVNKGEWTG